ncbi:hypothetical protein LTR84_002851 [Exophiala bonariae]|uniref:Gpi anchored protein n=1 Tax=Exophiala bonariae TaxID=1690606 RepID=A0AAV9N8U4_9EURO|nr:hypothetical protein LTR84_002851 [Exophiala bonariae]
MGTEIAFVVEEVKWNEAFYDIHFSFGHTEEPLELYGNQRKIRQRRQDSTNPTSAEALASSLIPAEADPSVTSVSIDLSHEGAGPDWFPTIKTTSPELPIEISCKDCQTKGNLQLSQGEWELALSDLDDIDSFSDIFKVGFVQFSIKDFLAHVELQIVPSVEGSTTLALFSLPIPGVTGFSLPGIGKAGLLFEPQLSLSWKLTGGIELTYGFELEIHNLDITIDFSDLKSSRVTGFNDINLSDLPFEANITDIELSIGIALQPRVTLGVEIFKVASAVTALTVDLPKTTTVLKLIATDTFNVNCEPLSATNATRTTTETTQGSSSDQAALQDFFPNLTHITTDSEVSIGLDLLASTTFDLSVINVKNLEFSSSLPLASTRLDRLAATQCLVFQPEATVTGGPAFAVATKALADARSVAAARAASSSSSSAAAAASASASNPGEPGLGEENAAQSLRVVGLSSWMHWLELYGTVLVGTLYFSL